MKETKTCPKCNSKSIFIMKGNTMNTATLIYLNKWNTKYVVLNRHLCTTCGHVEDYAVFTPKSSKWIDEIMKDKNDQESEYV